METELDQLSAPISFLFILNSVRTNKHICATYARLLFISTSKKKLISCFHLDQLINFLTNRQTDVINYLTAGLFSFSFLFTLLS